VKSVEKAIQILEYILSLSKWGIDSLRSFPIYKNEKTTNTETRNGIQTNTTGTE
jgi:hypothetical protein